MAQQHKPAAGRPNNPNATPEACRLYDLLCRYTNRDGFLSGAFDIDVSDEHPMGENYDRIAQVFGRRPAIYATRYFWTGSGFALHPQDSQNGKPCAARVNDTLYAHYQQGAILLIHADSSKLPYLGQMLEEKGKVESLPDASIHKKYINAIRFLDKTRADYDEEVGRQFWRIVCEWGDALEELESRGVRAYMFRPFLEMNSKRFFGDCEEGYAAFRRVWRQVYAYLINERHLNGCLLTFAPADYTYLTLSAQAFYPGDDVVDVLAPTFYPGEDGRFQKPTESNYVWMKDAGKPLGLSELSVRTGNWRIAKDTPAGDWAQALQVMLEDFPAVSFVNTWGGSAYTLLPYEEDTGFGNRSGDVFLSSPYVVNLDSINRLP